MVFWDYFKGNMMIIMQKNSFRKNDAVVNAGFAVSLGLIFGVYVFLSAVVAVWFPDIPVLFHVMLPSAVIIPTLCLSTYFTGKPGKLMRKFKLVNLHPSHISISFAGLVILLVVMGDLVSLYHRILTELGVPLVKPPIEELVRNSEGYTLLGLCLGIIFLAPITEELLFRRFIFGFLAPRCGFIAALLITAFLFAFIHFSVYSFPALFILGIAFQLIYLKFGSLYPAMFMHAFNNAIAVCVIFFVVK
jgi:hypothetical protein